MTPTDDRVLGRAVTEGQSLPLESGDPIVAARAVRRALADARRHAGDVVALVVAAPTDIPTADLARLTRRALGAHGDTVHAVALTRVALRAPAGSAPAGSTADGSADVVTADDLAVLAADHLVAGAFLSVDPSSASAPADPSSTMAPADQAAPDRPDRLGIAVGLAADGTTVALCLAPRGLPPGP